MFAELLAVALASAWAQSTPAPAQSPVVAVPVATPGLATMSFDPSGKRTSCVENYSCTSIGIRCSSGI